MLVPKPYVYKLQFQDGKLYIGMRTRNVTERRHYSNDLLKVYRTSSRVVQRRILSGDMPEIIGVWEFDSPQEASSYETYLIDESWKASRVHSLNFHNGDNTFFLDNHIQAAAAKSRIGLKWWVNGDQEMRSRDCPGEGWVRGRCKGPFAQRIGSTTYTDGKTHIYLQPGDPIPSGFYKGQCDKYRLLNSKGNQGKRWYTDGKQDRKFYPTQVPDGWKPGRAFRHEDSTKTRISSSMKGIPVSDRKRQKPILRYS